MSALQCKASPENKFSTNKCQTAHRRARNARRTGRYYRVNRYFGMRDGVGCVHDNWSSTNRLVSTRRKSKCNINHIRRAPNFEAFRVLYQRQGNGTSKRHNTIARELNNIRRRSIAKFCLFCHFLFSYSFRATISLRTPCTAPKSMFNLCAFWGGGVGGSRLGSRGIPIISGINKSCTAELTLHQAPTHNPIHCRADYVAAD